MSTADIPAAINSLTNKSNDFPAIGGGVVLTVSGLHCSLSTLTGDGGEVEVALQVAPRHKLTKNASSDSSEAVGSSLRGARHKLTKNAESDSSEAVG